MGAKQFTSCILSLALLAATARALSPVYLECQRQKPAGFSSLVGCPPGTIYVAKNDTKAHFTSVQAAVNSLREGVPATILIGAGEYHETLNVTRKAPLTLLGQISNTTTRAIGAPAPAPLVHIWDNAYIKTGMDDAQSAVLLIAPSFNASLIGAGPTGAPLQPLFGNIDFKAYNLAFENRAANYAISQALVTDISYTNASFYGCTFSSYQDTWYTGRNASTYVVDSTIYGQTDYLFGFGTAWFENVTLANRACGGGLVAWKGTNQSDAPGNCYGAYISNSRIIRSPDANATTVTEGMCSLGRPWNELATTVYLHTYIGSDIRPSGFTPWGGTRPNITNTTFYAEYASYGPGANQTSRLPEEHILTDQQAKNFTIPKVFLGWPKWIDYTYSS